MRACVRARVYILRSRNNYQTNILVSRWFGNSGHTSKIIVRSDLPCLDIRASVGSVKSSYENPKIASTDSLLLDHYQEGPDSMAEYTMQKVASRLRPTRSDLGLRPCIHEYYLLFVPFKLVQATSLLTVLPGAVSVSVAVGNLHLLISKYYHDKCTAQVSA